MTLAPSLYTYIILRGKIMFQEQIKQLRLSLSMTQAAFGSQLGNVSATGKKESYDHLLKHWPELPLPFMCLQILSSASRNYAIPNMSMSQV